MRWSKNKSRYAGEEDLLASEEIIHEAFYEGHLKWHIYQMALSKIRANMNGSWMFEKRNDNYALKLSIFDNLDKNE